LLPHYTTETEDRKSPAALHRKNSAKELFALGKVIVSRDLLSDVIKKDILRVTYAKEKDKKIRPKKSHVLNICKN